MTPAVPLIEARALTRRFRAGRRWWGRAASVTAVDDLDLALEEGEIFGLVGASGSGKSTLARCFVGLLEPTLGEVRWRGEAIAGWPASRRRRYARDAQLMYQDTATSLNPRLTVGESLREPLDVHAAGTKQERDETVVALLAMVGLDPALARRKPGELSGGQRQRVVLARAMALSPSLLIADEPVSSLDRTTQAQVVDLLLDLRARRHLTCLLILHDLHLVQRTCSRVGVMCQGRLVEVGRTDAVFEAPAHRHTQQLLAARLWPDPDRAAHAPPFAPGPPIAPEEVRRPLVSVGPDHLAAVG